MNRRYAPPRFPGIAGCGEWALWEPQLQTNHLTPLGGAFVTRRAEDVDSKSEEAVFKVHVERIPGHARLQV